MIAKLGNRNSLIQRQISQVAFSWRPINCLPLCTYANKRLFLSFLKAYCFLFSLFQIFLLARIFQSLHQIQGRLHGPNVSVFSSVPFNYPVALLFVLPILAHHGPEDIWADVILSQNILADPLVPHGVLAHSSIFERQSGCSNSMRRYLARGGAPLYKLYRCLPIGLGLCAVLVSKQVYTLPTSVWNQVWFSGELRECMDVSIVSIPNE